MRNCLKSCAHKNQSRDKDITNPSYYLFLFSPWLGKDVMSWIYCRYLYFIPQRTTLYNISTSALAQQFNIILMIWWSYKDNHPDELMSTYLGRFYFPPSWPIPVYLEYIIWLMKYWSKRIKGRLKERIGTFPNFMTTLPDCGPFFCFKLSKIIFY